MFNLQVRYLSFFFGIVSILSFFNIIYSYYLNLYLNLDTYYYSLIISFLFFIFFYKIKITKQKPNLYNKILTVFLGYVLVPLILSIPFYFSIYNITFLDSFFESVSGFTSDLDFVEIIHSMDWGSLLFIFNHFFNRYLWW